MYIGASGFYHTDWVGNVYPDGVSKEDAFQIYTEKIGFNLVELTQSYRENMKREMVETLLEAAPENFGFIARVSKSLTSDIRGSDGSYIRNEKAVSDFLESLKPLTEANALKCVVARFPLKFKKNDGLVEHIKWLSEALQGVDISYEFLNSSWGTQSVFDLLQGVGAGVSIIDGPDTSDVMPYISKVTSSFAFFRLLGKNIKWTKLPPKERLSYEYGDFELRDLCEKIGAVSENVDETFVLLDNYPNGALIKNGIRLRGLLDAREQMMEEKALAEAEGEDPDNPEESE